MHFICIRVIWIWNALQGQKYLDTLAYQYIHVWIWYTSFQNYDRSSAAFKSLRSSGVRCCTSSSSQRWRMGLTSELGAERTVMLEQERDECDPWPHSCRPAVVSQIIVWSISSRSHRDVSLETWCHANDVLHLTIFQSWTFFNFTARDVDSH